MKLIVCLDDRNGMLFYGKRLSRDRVVCEKVVNMVGAAKLWMNGYSAKMFADISKNICVDEDFLDYAGEEEFCFLENRDIMPYMDKISQILLFKWNRHYPADTFFPIDLCAKPWKLTDTEEFSGSSHNKITMEVYKR